MSSMGGSSNGHLIDTSVLISYLRQNTSFVTRLDALPQKFTSPTIVAELAYGAYRSRDPIDGMQRVDALIGLLPSVEIDRAIWI